MSEKHQEIASIRIYDSRFAIENGEKDGKPVFFVSEHTEKGVANQFVVGTYLEALTRFAYMIDTQAQFHQRNEPALKVPDNGVLTADVCVEGSREDHYKGKLIVLRPDALRPEYHFASEQLFYATGGFGCAPNSRGDKVFGITLHDGEEDVFRRDDFMGIADIGRLPQWARSAWHELNTLNKGLEARKHRDTGPER